MYVLGPIAPRIFDVFLKVYGIISLMERRAHTYMYLIGDYVLL